MYTSRSLLNTYAFILTPNLSDNSFNAYRKRKDEARLQKRAYKKIGCGKQCYTLIL